MPVTIVDEVTGASQAIKITKLTTAAEALEVYKTQTGAQAQPGSTLVLYEVCESCVDYAPLTGVRTCCFAWTTHLIVTFP